MQNTIKVVALLAIFQAGPLNAQTPEEIGATIGSYLRASYILEYATSECSIYGIQPHDANSDLRDVMSSRWAGAFTADVLNGVRNEARKGVQTIRSLTERNSKDFFCGFLVGSASQGHLLRKGEWSRLKSAFAGQRR